MSPAAEEEREPRDLVLGLTAVQRVVAVGLFAVVGGVVGFLLPWILELIASLPWAPFEGPLRLVEALDGVLPIGTAAIGALIGSALTIVGTTGSATLTVTPSDLRLALGGEVRVVERSRVAGVFRVGDEVVVVDGDRRELVRVEVDVPTAELAEALRAHRYPWRASPSGGSPTDG